MKNPNNVQKNDSARYVFGTIFSIMVLWSTITLFEYFNKFLKITGGGEIVYVIITGIIALIAANYNYYLIYKKDK